MKTFIRLFFPVVMLALPMIAMANVLVKGHVTNANGQPANNYEVHILSDSSDRGCTASHVKYTNTNGIYQDTLTCYGAFKYVTVWVRDCNGAIISKYLPAPTSGIVEANFVVCAASKCHAQFSFYQILPQPAAAGIAFRFQGELSTTSPGEKIIANYWNFGDGTPTTNNIFDPAHSYLQPGSYTVCLKIVSASGCTDSVCQTVVVPPALHCKAAFAYSVGTTGWNNIHFQSNMSTGDSIILRRWTFGDGTSLGGNAIDPTHVYANSGNYRACLYIQTKAGCSDSICETVTVTAPLVQCSPTFNFTDTGLNGHFYSAGSQTVVGDSITARVWNFGDGQTLTGNVVSPIHHYTSGGSYNVCLRIITRLGCEKTFCNVVHIAGDSAVNHDLIRLVSIYPNPATTQFTALVWSMYNSVAATLAIYDVYGVLKWSQQTTLSQGNNTIAVPLSQLMAGPYMFRLTTIYSVSNKTFFKL